ncbi:MAG: hypothetical protein N2Z74_09595, partial [Syntrophales bacterium]|nr:hypothetical protein [Syntrophales bacterium]
EEDRIKELPDGYVLMDARLEIEKMEEYFGVKFADGEFETVGGLILSAIGRIPVTGEVVQIEPFEVVIELADERSIKKVKIKKKQDPDT